MHRLFCNLFKGAFPLPGFSGTGCFAIALGAFFHYLGLKHGRNVQVAHYGVDLSVKMVELPQILLSPLDVSGIAPLFHPVWSF